MLTRRVPEDSLDAYADGFIRTWKVLRVDPFPEDEAADPHRARVTWERGLNAPGRARQLAAIMGSGSRRERLGHVRAPALVIHGKVDPLVPVDHGITLASLIPDARLHIVEGMGHALPIRFWPQIVDLIARHAGAPPAGAAAA
jgi:pimeloyl-ACP methyl ester carboxylesterase